MIDINNVYLFICFVIAMGCYMFVYRSRFVPQEYRYELGEWIRRVFFIGTSPLIFEGRQLTIFNCLVFVEIFTAYRHDIKKFIKELKWIRKQQ